MSFHPNPGPADPTTLTAVGLRRLRDFLRGDDDTPHTAAPPAGDPMTAFLQLVTLAVGDPPPDAPRRFGRFRVGRCLGRGRFGVVFLADDPTVGRLVALKLPQLGVLSDPDLLRRFHRNGEAAAALDHPGIVAVFEAGVEGGVPYIASAYVAGPTLHQWLLDRAAPVPARDAAGLLLQMAAAVQHAHERGVLHCDLKPSNVLLCSRVSPRREDSRVPEGRGYIPKITDFDLARLALHDQAGTRTHLVAGTLPYMSPEQTAGTRRDLTAGSDVYALGVILYELLLGTPPPTDAEPPPPRTHRPDLPRDLEAIVLRCLEKEPAGRYATAAELADDLNRFLDGRPTRARPVGVDSRVLRWARRRPILFTLWLGLAGAVTGLLGLAGHHLQAQDHFQREIAAARSRDEGRQRDLRRLQAKLREMGVEPDLLGPPGSNLLVTHGIRIGPDTLLLHGYDGRAVYRWTPTTGLVDTGTAVDTLVGGRDTQGQPAAYSRSRDGRIYRHTGSALVEYPDPYNQFQALVQADDGHAYIKMSGHLHRFDDTHNTHLSALGMVQALVKGEDGRAYVLQGGVVSRFDGRQLTPAYTGRKRFTSLVRAADGNLYVTAGGIYRFNAGGRRP